MKKLLTLGLILASAAVAFGQRPMLVGHRGSSYGVENTVESFTNGAKLGYEYLETDFKVTKDLKLVCTHDDDLSRLGGSSLTIAGSTLAELQAVPLTQTRLGTKYTGRLCSAQEYLDVCKEYGVRPLIELKWATGINSNDCSNIPLLIKLVEDNGFRDKCIIMTSMKPCLEYIREHYPDIELQFLTGQYWSNHFNWCVNHGIDVDIQAGYFDKTTVQRFHTMGLKVNMWTTNTTDGYKQYGNWGCDFITTDNLDPKNLPDLDPSVMFPPNTVDYPENQENVKGSYNADPAETSPFADALDGLTVKKAVLDGDSWIVLADGDGCSRIVRVDALTGAVTSTYASISPAPVFADIAISADKLLVAVTADGKQLYSWASATAAPQLYYTLETPAPDARLVVSGRQRELKVYLAVRDDATGAVSVQGLQLKDGNLTLAAENKSDIVCAPDAWKKASVIVTTTSRDCLLFDTPASEPVEYRFDWANAGAQLKQEAKFADGKVAADLLGISFHRRAAKVYAVLPGNADGLNVCVNDVTDGLAEAVPVTDAIALGTATPDYLATGMSVIDGKLYTLVFAAPLYSAHIMMNAEAVTVTPQNVELELVRDWIFSESTDNKPENIDGTNAQQGTAVNGRFYINNCAEKKIHIFDHTGYLGNIPGGSGWGCARDDAGNIIVRDDKLTGNTHNFIVYPAGALPDNYGEPVTFTATVKLEGQTNFINAGGDLLGGTGHIYLFPNKQTAVNIITVQKGVVVGSKASADLAFAGSTAGYVAPVEDNTENWIYQVRNTGMYMYTGGVNTNISPVNTGTVQPKRNNTGGLAYFTLLGNKILVHNSGLNYKGGFTVRNLSAGTGDTDQPVANIAPIGTMGYVDGGNYSTFNWLIPEKVSDSQYTLYQYCPANGFAKYTLRDKNAGVDDIVADGDADNWYAVAEGGTLTVRGIAVSTLEIYNVSGIRVARTRTDTADISALTPGLYFVTVNGATTRKFVKK